MSDEDWTTTEQSWPPAPSVRYNIWSHRKLYDNGIVRIPGANSVVVAYRDGTLVARVRGQIATESGERGPKRSAEVDLGKPQPSWLDDLIADAAKRLGVP